MTATTTSSTQQTPTPPRHRDFAALGSVKGPIAHHRSPSFASSTTSTTAGDGSLRSLRRLSKGFQPKSPAPTAVTSVGSTSAPFANAQARINEDSSPPQPIFVAASSTSGNTTASAALGEAIAHGTRADGGDVFVAKHSQHDAMHRSGANRSKLRKEVKKGAPSKA